MHNAKQDILDTLKLIEAGYKYEAHDKHVMRWYDRALYWFSTVLIWSGVTFLIFIICKAIIYGC